jgi:fructoselysine-6-P-deglycase FrlB-like protein
MLELAAELKDANSLMFFARGNNYATALEAALKVRPCARHAAQAFHSLSCFAADVICAGGSCSAASTGFVG